MNTPERDWPEALATVASCVYDVRAGRALAFGLPASKHFRIAYTYWADGKVHNGEYFSEKAVPQGTLFPLRYNPEQPHENSHAPNRPSTRGSLLVFGVAGSLLLSTLWFLLLKSCH